MKFAISLFSVLAMVVGGMLFFQYQAYSSDLEIGNGHYYYSQEIEVVQRGDSLDVRHHFRGLPNQRMNIQWPEAAQNPTCFIETENSCDRLSEDMTNFAMGEAKSQSVSYIIPLEDNLQKTKLFENIFAQLKNGDVSYSVLHISTDKNVNGQWVSALPLIGSQSLSIVNNVMFSGEGELHDLYWSVDQNMAMQFENEHISLYSTQAPTKDFVKAVEELDHFKGNHMAVVRDANFANTTLGGILFLPEFDVATIENEVVMTQLKQDFNFSNSPGWLTELIASITIDKPMGSTKAQEIFAILEEKMNDAQKQMLHEKIEALKGENISPAIMDEQLSAVFDAKTSFIQWNTETESVYPLLFEDERSVYLNELARNDVHTILDNGQVLYTADTLLPHLGYSASEGEMGYYVNNPKNVYRFPRKAEELGFYVYNQKRYDVPSLPIRKIGDKYFIEETWLQRLFHVQIQKTEGRILMDATVEESK